MKRKILSSLIILLAVSSYVKAQGPCPSIRYIEVIGKSEKEIPVNEIYVQITLKEYFKDPKNRKGKVLINQLESELQKAVSQSNISIKNLTVSNISSYNDFYDTKSNKPSEYMASKQYLLKLSSIGRIQSILSKVDSKGISNTYISKYTNTDIKNYEESLQKEAFLNAKEKAMHIASVAGATIGKVLEIHNNGYTDDPGYRPLMMMRASAKADASQDSMPDVDFKNLKIKNEQRVLFELL